MRKFVSQRIWNLQWRGTKKGAFEVVFGQKPNSFDSVGIMMFVTLQKRVESIICQDLPDNVNFSIYMLTT